MSSNPNKIISLQELINAQVDAYKLELIMNEAPWVEITNRLGRKCYSIATIQGIIDQYEIKADAELAILQEAINVALAAGAGAAGWNASLIVDGNKNQHQINQEQSEYNQKINTGLLESGVDESALGTNPNLIPSRHGHSIRRPQKTTEDVILFVDPANGNDSNDGKTQSTALKTFAKAMSLTPYQIFHKVRIYCLDGVYDEAPIVQFLWMSSSRWANFEVIGHTPENPAYTDLKPENIVFSKTLSTGERQAVLWGAMPGSNFNTFLKGVTIDNFWPYDVTMQVHDCIIQRGGGAFNNYGIGGHGGRVGFNRVKFKDFPADGLLCEATDFSQFHFYDCTLENVLCPIATARNNSTVTFERCGWNLDTSVAEPGSFIGGENSTYLNVFGLGKDKKTDSFVAVSSTEVGSGSATYNTGGQLVVYGQDYVGSDAGSINTFIGSRTKDIGTARFDVRYATTTGVETVFRVTRFGIVNTKVGYQVTPAASSATSGFNNTLFVDSSDNKLKFRDSEGVIKTVNLT